MAGIKKLLLYIVDLKVDYKRVTGPLEQQWLGLSVAALVMGIAGAVV